jgi:hypothetical protein
MYVVYGMFFRLTDGRTLTHDKSSHGLWPGELKKGVLYVSYYTWLFLFVVQHETNTLTFSSPLIHTLSKPYPVTKNVNTCDWLIVSLFVWMIDWLTLNEQYLSYNQWASGCCFTLTQQIVRYNSLHIIPPFLAHLAIGHVSFCHG